MIGRLSNFFSKKQNPHPMLLEFEKNKCIFFHIPKTGGMSISKSLFGNIEWGHRDVDFYINHFGKDKFDLFFKFAFVRNPFDRLYSAYNFLQNGGINKRDKTFFDNVLSHYQNFDDFVINGLHREEIINWVHFLPQHSFLINNEGRLTMDFIGKTEDIESDFKTVSIKLNIEGFLKKINTSNKKKNPLSLEVKDKIKNIYYKDFTLFYPSLL